MRKIVSVLLLIFVAACTNTTPVDENNQRNDVFSLKGKVSNWSGENNKFVVFGYGDTEIFGVSKIEHDGYFELDLKNPTKDKLDKLTLYPTGGVCSNTLTISDRNAKGIMGTFSVYNPSDPGVKGFLHNMDMPLNGNIQQVNRFANVQYIYVDRDVDIVGEEACVYPHEKQDQYFDLLQRFDLHLKKGWNKVVYQNKNLDDYSSYVKVSNFEPFNTKWFYDSIL